ncbi:hypothetical protein CY35_05G051900 [Sphagnum magellanicum]|nr:hypothetical protein CY35_05G051900 [Sphagnum magellanicum]
MVIITITVEREKLATHLLRKSSSVFSTTVAPTTFACCCAQHIPNKTLFIIPTHTLDYTRRSTHTCSCMFLTKGNGTRENKTTTHGNEGKEGWKNEKRNPWCSNQLLETQYYYYYYSSSSNCNSNKCTQ